MVLINGVMIGVCTDYDCGPHEGTIELGFIILFVIEMATKWFGFGEVFWKDWWNIGDFVIVVLAVIELVSSLLFGQSHTMVGNMRLDFQTSIADFAHTGTPWRTDPIDGSARQLLLAIHVK